MGGGYVQTTEIHDILPFGATLMPTTIREISINNERTTPKICHDVTTLMEI